MTTIPKIAEAIAAAYNEAVWGDAKAGEYQMEIATKMARAAVEAMREPDEAVKEAGVRASGGWCKPYEAPRESGVPMECDISEEDARHINSEAMVAFAEQYRAAIDAILQGE